MNFNVSRVGNYFKVVETYIHIPQTFHKVMLGTISSNVIVLLSKLSVAFLNELLTSRAAMETLY